MSEARSFLSPFSVKREYVVEWAKVNPNWRGVQNILTHLTSRDEEIIQALAQCRMATSGQLGKAFWGNPKNATQRLALLSRCGVLVRHELKSRTLTIPVFTLGPLGAQIADITFLTWWTNLDVDRALSFLVTAQLFLRMRQMSDDVRMIPAPHPFQGVIVMGETEYAVIAARGLNADVRWAVARRMFVVAETEEQLLAIAREAKSPARYTTDEMLFTSPIQEAFWRYSNGRLEKEVVSLRQPHQANTESVTESRSR